jgi:hypothetical protein
VELEHLKIETRLTIDKWKNSRWREEKKKETEKEKMK